MSNLSSPNGSIGRESVLNHIRDISPQYSAELLKNLNNLWKDEYFCDLELSVCMKSTCVYNLKTLLTMETATHIQLDDSSSIERVTIRTHKVIAAASSPLLRKLLVSDLPPGPIMLDQTKIDANSLRTLLNYMYCGKIDLQNHEQILALIVASQYLGMQDATRQCGQYLIKFMNNNNIIEYLTLAQKFNLSTLERSAFKCILENFNQIAKTKGWFEIRPKDMSCIISQNGLQCKDEYQIVDSVVQWTLHDIQQRHQYFVQFIGNPQCIRLSNMSPETLRSLTEEVRQSSQNNTLLTTDTAQAKEVFTLLQHAVTTELNARQEGKKRMKRTSNRSYTSLKCIPNRCTHTFDGENAHSMYVYSLVESDGMLYSGSRDHTIKCWSLYNKQCVATVSLDNRVWKLLAVEPKHNCPALTHKIVSGSWDNTIRVWNKFPDFRCCRKFVGHTGWVLDLITCNGKLVSGSADNSIIVWNVETGEPEKQLTGHTNHVYALEQIEGKLISGSSDKTIIVWDTSNWTQIQTLTGHSGAIRCLTIVDHHIWSGSADHTIRVWDTKTTPWQPIKTIPAHSDSVESIVQYDSDHVASASRDETIKIWNKKTYQVGSKLNGHKNWVLSLAVLKGNNVFVSGSADNTIKMWDYIAR